MVAVPGCGTVRLGAGNSWAIASDPGTLSEHFDHLGGFARSRWAACRISKPAFPLSARAARSTGRAACRAASAAAARGVAGTRAGRRGQVATGPGVHRLHRQLSCHRREAWLRRVMDHDLEAEVATRRLGGQVILDRLDPLRIELDAL